MAWALPSSYGSAGFASATQPFSKFSESIQQLIRLDYLWRKAEDKANLGDLLGWKWVLDSVWRELYADAIRCKKKGRAGADWVQFITDADKSILDNESKKAWSKMYYSLDHKHKVLKDLQTEVGKGSRYVESHEDEFD